MTTYAEVPTGTSGRDSSHRRPTWWTVLLVGLIAAGLGIGVGYLVFARQSAADIAPEEMDRVVTLLDRYEAVWRGPDVQGMRLMCTEDATIEGVRVAASSAPALETLVARYEAEGRGFEYVEKPLVVPTASPAGDPDGPSYLVLVKSTWWTGSDDGDEIREYLIVTEDGALKIRREVTYT